MPFLDLYSKYFVSYILGIATGENFYSESSLFQAAIRLLWRYQATYPPRKNVLSKKKKMERIFTLFVTEVTPSVITVFFWSWSEYRVNRTRFHSLRTEFFTLPELESEWNSLLNEWNFFTPLTEWIIHSIFFWRVHVYWNFEWISSTLSVKKKSTASKNNRVTCGYNERWVI